MQSQLVTRVSDHRPAMCRDALGKIKRRRDGAFFRALDFDTADFSLPADVRHGMPNVTL
jgi:hypothetical protein